MCPSNKQKIFLDRFQSIFLTETDSNPVIQSANNKIKTKPQRDDDDDDHNDHVGNDTFDDDDDDVDDVDDNADDDDETKTLAVMNVRQDFYV